MAKRPFSQQRNKYRVAPPAERTFNGRCYDSKAEARYARQLALRRQAGDIITYVEQPRVELGLRENVYRPDFLVIPHGDVPYYVDVKGTETTAFRKNKRLWARYGDLELRIVKSKRDGFETVEVVPARDPMEVA